MRKIEIRDFEAADWPAVWSIIHEVITTGETFAYDPAMNEHDAREMWCQTAPGRTTVSVDAGLVIGTAEMGVNRPGPGAHVATGSIMVAADHRGRGVGAALARDAVDWARREGYASMQFNAVVETNVAAVRLYKRIGFSVVGTVPRAFEHPRFGRVGLLVMYNEFGR